MKKRMKVQRIVILTMLMVFAIMVTVTAASTTNGTKENETTTSSETTKKHIGKKKKKVKKLKVTFKTKKGKTYCRVNGKKAKKQFITVKNKIYYFDKNGVMVKGWKKYKKDYYYFDRSSGKMYKNTKVDGIKLNKQGKAKKKKVNINKINTMIKAKNTLESITSYNDSKSQKLRKAFDWIAKKPYRRYRLLSKMYKQKGWESTFANDIFDHGDGCCVSESAALAFLVHEAGYKNVYVAHDSSHAWMELNNRVYDALFARAKDYNKYYNLSYGNYNCHPIDKRKI